ncbi:hypothetical protein BGY98DRAFT_965410 [Russula aff. rugulosa BPL654]|nr:hypothetical protein BGY98DRAFT_965410 [Russula aff. rugulosa BPL654]
MIVASFVYERFDDDVSRGPCVNGVIAHRLILCIRPYQCVKFRPPYTGTGWPSALGPGEFVVVRYNRSMHNMCVSLACQCTTTLPHKHKYHFFGVFGHSASPSCPGSNANRVVLTRLLPVAVETDPGTFVSEMIVGAQGDAFPGIMLSPSRILCVENLAQSVSVVWVRRAKHPYHGVDLGNTIVTGLRDGLKPRRRILYTAMLDNVALPLR